MEIEHEGTIMRDSVLELELSSITITKGEASKVANVNYTIVDTHENATDRNVARISVPIDTGQEGENYELKTYTKKAKIIIRNQLRGLATKIDDTIPRNTS